MDDGNSDQTSTTDSFSTQTSAVPVIATDQSLLNLDDPDNVTPSNELPIARVEPDEPELSANSSENIDSISLENTSMLPGEAHLSQEGIDLAKETKPPENQETTALEILETSALETLETKALETLQTSALETLETKALETVETKAPEILDTTASETLETVAPETQKTIASETLETTVLETREITAPETQETTVPETLETTALETQQTTTPETLETTVSETQETTALETLKSATSETPESTVLETRKTTASKTLSTETALCDENIDASSSGLLLVHDQTSNDSTSRAFTSDILPENNQINPTNETNEHPAYSNFTNFDKPNYSVQFMEDLSKIEKNNSLIASDLMSSETMNDFFDEMYDMNYANHYKNRKVDESSNLAQNNYCADQVDGNLKDQWSVAALESDFRGCPRSTDVANIKSSLKRVGETEPSKDYLPCKKARKGITFDSVSVYYFPRTQGFTCIPSQGGSTLGMSWNHTHIRKFSLGEYAAEQRKAHRQMCSQQLDSSTNWNELSNISSDDSDSDEIVSDSEVDCENYNFLQPIPTRERRAMLRAAGIHKIDSREKDECRTIRLSREFCGCTCQIYCDPERCVCAQAGIKCQVDRMNFPCSCTRDGCANENGRIEFNPMRVRTHFIHTLMRLEMEKKKEEEEEHNHRLLFGDLDNMAQLAPYPLAQSSSTSGGANLLTTFSYHPDSLPYYAQPPSQQPSLYDVAPAPAQSSESAQLPQPTFGYDSHQYAMASGSDDSSYSQLTSVPNLTVLGETSSALAPSYSMSDEQCLRLVGADYGAVDALAQMRQQTDFPEAATAYHVEPFFAEEQAKEGGGLECHSEAETLDTSAEISEETEKEEESDVENFGDIIKKTMVESVIA